MIDKHTRALKIKLILQQIIEDVTVLRAVRIVYLVIRTHDRSNAGTNGVRKRPMMESEAGSPGQANLLTIGIVHA